jgi:RNA polymerase sigma-70 factor (ECF subfamily)
MDVTMMTFRGRRVGKAEVALVAAQSNAERFSEVFTEHLDDLVIYFTRRTFSADLGIELAAETLAHVFEQRQRFRGSSREEEEAWIFAVARTQLHRYWRRETRERGALERLGIELPRCAPDDLAAIEERAQLPELRQRLGAGLAHLTARQRSAIQLRIIDECGYDEVASVLGMSEQAARAHVSRGLRALAAELDELSSKVA